MLPGEKPVNLEGWRDGMAAAQRQDVSARRKHEKHRGRALYEKDMIHGMNRFPVEELLTWILGGVLDPFADDDTVPFTLRDLAERRLVEGAMVLHDAADGWVFLERLLKVEKRLILQRVDLCEESTFFKTKTASAITREIRRKDGKWLIRDYTNYGTKDQALFKAHGDKGLIAPVASLPVAELKVFPFGRGILEPVNSTLLQMDRNEQRIDQYTQPSNQALISTGMLGRNGSESLTDAIRNPETEHANIANANIKLARLVNTQTPALLHERNKDFVPIVCMLTHTTRMSESAQVSGYSRQLTLRSMITMVDDARADIDRVVKVFAPNVGQLPWPPNTVLDAQEKLAQLDYLERLLKLQVITREQFEARVKQI